MDKRFQVFVSSTYTDLKTERSKVIQTLLEMDCIPAGMELFPAADEEQWSFIRKIIDDCDYYLLIIAGRYGTADEDGISYTEKEYDYAVSKGLKIIALLLEKPDELPRTKSEIDSKIKENLKRFRDKVASGRLVKFWSKADELAGLVSLSLNKTIKMHPAVGWVRADKVSNEQLLTELNDLRKENTELKSQIAELKESSQPKLDNLADLEQSIRVAGTYWSNYNKSFQPWENLLSWRQIFTLLAPFILKTPHEDSVQTRLAQELSQGDKDSPRLDDQIFQTIKIQFIALGLVQVKNLKTMNGGTGWFWFLTPLGNKYLMEFRTVKKNS